MKKMAGIVILAAICIILSVAQAVEYPQFKSAVSTTGITANFDTLYLFEYPAARCGDGHENRLNLSGISFLE